MVERIIAFLFIGSDDSYSFTHCAENDPFWIKPADCSVVHRVIFYNQWPYNTYTIMKYIIVVTLNYSCFTGITPIYLDVNLIISIGIIDTTISGKECVDTTTSNKYIKDKFILGIKKCSKAKDKAIDHRWCEISLLPVFAEKSLKILNG